MHEFIDQFQLQLNKVGESIHETFFALRPLVPTQRPSNNRHEALERLNISGG